jgi:hypothetical protein
MKVTKLCICVHAVARPLSNFEVNLGYQDVKDIAVTVKMPLA